MGVTAPLVLDSADTGLLRLPFLAERNFSIADECRPAILMRGAGLATETDSTELTAPQSDTNTLQQSLRRTDLDRPVTVRCNRAPGCVRAWASDERSEGGRTICQEVAVTPVHAPQEIVFVVDGSKSMREYIEPVTEALSCLPPSFRFQVIVASDDVVELGPMQASATDRLQAAAQTVRGVP